MLAEDAPLEVRGKDHPWVSRGGIKLDHGLTHFGFDVTGAVALDVGSSTGGFTDVLLTRGAAKVYAVDVGTNQLAWKLRQDPRVVVHEQTNARDADSRASSPSRSTSSFATRASSGWPRCSKRRSGSPSRGAKLVALVKPQFEAGREEVGKGGVVRDPAVHERVCAEAAAWVEAQGWTRARRRAEPDHRARGQCRIPARRDKELAGDSGDSRRRGWRNRAEAPICAPKGRRRCSPRTRCSTTS